MFELKDKSKILSLISSLGIEYENARARIINHDAKCYVDDVEDIKSFIVIDDYWHIPYNLTSDRLVELLKTLGIRHVGFCGIPKETSELYKGIGEVKWHNPCYLFEAKEKMEGLEKDLPEGYYLDSLKKYDVHIINHLYTYRNEESFQDITNDIVNRPSSVIRLLDGTPVSWVLMHPDNSLGIMYTKEGYRKMGFGKIVSVDLINKAIEKSYRPFIHIVTDNLNSIKLANSVGFTKVCEVDWIGYELYY